ncbi:MAG: hypothetical protein ABW199_07970 [Caulobacterales bacterium]
MTGMKILLLGLALALTSACATTPMPMQQATFANVQALRAEEIPPLTLGQFSLADGLPRRLDRSIQIRATTLRAPENGTFSDYLRKTLETQLHAAGKLEAAGPVVVSAQLTQSFVTSDGPTGNGVLGARFIVRRNGNVIYDQELIVRDEWPTSFIGAIAIPAAMDHYTALYPTLVQSFVTDSRLRQALSV